MAATPSLHTPGKHLCTSIVVLHKEREYLLDIYGKYFGTRLRELLLGSADFSPLEFMKGEHSGTSHSRTSHALHEDH